MSRTELHIGTMREVNLKGLTIEEWCQRKCESINYYELPSYAKNYTELMLNLFYEEYIIINSKLYALEDQECEDASISKITKNEDGSYSYIMGFHNGGTCLLECLEESLKEFT